MATRKRRDPLDSMQELQMGSAARMGPGSDAAVSGDPSAPDHPSNPGAGGGEGGDGGVAPQTGGGRGGRRSGRTGATARDATRGAGPDTLAQSIAEANRNPISFVPGVFEDITGNLFESMKDKFGITEVSKKGINDAVTQAIANIPDRHPAGIVARAVIDPVNERMREAGHRPGVGMPDTPEAWGAAAAERDAHTAERGRDQDRPRGDAGVPPPETAAPPKDPAEPEGMTEEEKWWWERFGIDPRDPSLYDPYFEPVALTQPTGQAAHAAVVSRDIVASREAAKQPMLKSSMEALL